MKRNGSGQHIAAQMNSRSDGSPLTSGVSVAVTKDNGTSTSGAGTLTHKANGHWNYAPTQSETDAAHIAFQFTHATGVNQTVNVYTTFPQTGDSFDRLGAPAGASIAADIATRATDAGVITAMENDTWSEPSAGVPAARPSLAWILRLLWLTTFNKRDSDGSWIRWFASDDDTVLFKQQTQSLSGVSTKHKIVAP